MERDARKYLQSLIGRTIPTLTGVPNTVLAIRGEEVVVATRRSPRGEPVLIQWVQQALDELLRAGELEISVDTVGYRSAFSITPRSSPLRGARGSRARGRGGRRSE